MDGRKDATQEVEKTIPLAHAEKCPVCNGFGTLKYGEKLCQACKGKGYVVVPNSIEQGEAYEDSHNTY
jgi:DnaJ-class molecular chaperone